MKSSQLLRILQRDGWFIISQVGSHLKMIHPTKDGFLMVPFHRSQEVGKGLEKKLLKKAGINKN
ncbi:MAG: type II toxin-antitoxin system HicA family toxin [Saprospiraceae bacterium]|nr:type II toxin-antitoxin system HicA family toxin [Candidatus Opimibacter iunctus]